MGGMISQEVAYQRPDLIKSLVILASNARLRLPTIQHILMPLSIFWPRFTQKAQVNALLDMLFSDEKWLHSPDERNSSLKTNRAILYAAIANQLNITGHPPLQTFLGQLSAVLTHNMSPERLCQIGKKIGYVVCVTGDDDKLIHHSATEYLAKHIGCKSVVLDKKGHALPKEAEFELIEVFENLMMSTKYK
jgi:pimeloyl-ACP methyl ester carboxylesterase